jgi:hypothetical protein
MSRATKAAPTSKKTSERERLEDPGWGPTVTTVPVEGHVLATGPPKAVATAREVSFAGGAVGALVICAGEVSGTGEPEEVRFGLAQVRRVWSVGPARVAHVVFAPKEPRPLLLGLVRLLNTSEKPLGLHYTELWDLPRESYRAAVGACECDIEGEERALADAGLAVRARPPEPPPSRGLALDLALVLPPGSVRELSFAYVAPPRENSAAGLVRAWRGEVPRALQEVVRAWQLRVGAGWSAVEAFREEVHVPETPTAGG